VEEKLSVKFHVAKLTARSSVYQCRANYCLRLVMKALIQRNGDYLKITWLCLI